MYEIQIIANERFYLQRRSALHDTGTIKETRSIGVDEVGTCIQTAVVEVFCDVHAISATAPGETLLQTVLRVAYLF